MTDMPLLALDQVELVLGSTSRYRAELLRRIAPHFRQATPDVDETPQPGEAPAALARRLAQAKAQAVAKMHPGALVIGSDQVAGLGAAILGKPGTAARAIRQLQASSANAVRFYTGLCLIDARREPFIARHALDITDVQFRTLTRPEIERYVEREQPLDCAGAFKSEGLGISLFEHIRSDDPSALVGLPLIALCRLLREAGIAVL